MASIPLADDLVRDYLLFRGFILSVKAFDAELKADKDKGFRPEQIVEHLQSLVAALDLSGLLDGWTHLERRIFCRLEHVHSMEARRLEASLFRIYLVNCLTGGKPEKVTDFFDRMTSHLYDLEEWKDWYVLPYLPSPEENQLFRVYFTRHWQELFWISLHNFLSAIFKCMPYPSLLKYEQVLSKMNCLQEENEKIKQKQMPPEIRRGAEFCEPPPVLMDDFFVIAQESPPETQSSGKSLRSLIRNIGGGSPLLGHKQRANGRQNSMDDTGVKKAKPRSPSVPPSFSTGKTTPEPTPVPKMPSTCAKQEIPPKEETGLGDSQKGEFLILGQNNVNIVHQEDSSHLWMVKDRNQISPKQYEKFPNEFGLIPSCFKEEYIEHHAPITHCKFNSTGNLVASSDLGGVIKVWNPHPTPYTITTTMSKSSVMALDWAAARERLLIYGTQAGRVRVYDTKDRRNLCDLAPEGKHSIKCLLGNPLGTHFVCATRGEEPQLLLYNLTTLQAEMELRLVAGGGEGLLPPQVNCCAFNHNSQLIMAGTTDGRILIFDTRVWESIASWDGHKGSEVYSLQFSPDEISCFTMGGDKKFIQWDFNKTGQKLSELNIHSEASGPFTYADSTYDPAGKLFAFDSKGSHVLTCGPSGGVIYKLNSGQLFHEISLGGHRTTVNTVDWTMGLGYGTCLTASLDSQILVTTLLPQ